MDLSTHCKNCWRCIKYYSNHRKSRLHICISTNDVTKPLTVHTCSNNATTLECRKFSEQIVFRALYIQETPDIILPHCYKSKASIPVTLAPMA